MIKTLLYIIGILLTSSGIVFIIIYLNLLNMGYSFAEYVNFIIKRLECINLVIGSGLLTFLIRRDNKNDIHI